MTTLEELLGRPGLPRTERALIAGKAAIAGGDWTRLRACLDAARAAGMARAQAEEMLLQAVLYYGFPRVVSAFETLAETWPDERAPSGGALPAEQQAAAGRRVFETIYGRNADAVRQKMRALHGELHDFVLEAAYGRILTRPGLPLRLRELLAVGALQALGQVPQLVAHARGALACGATADEVREALVTAGAEGRELEGAMRRILRTG